MKRRLLIATLLPWPAFALQAQDEPPRPRHKVSAATLHEALSARLPRQLGVRGLLELAVGAPRLLLMPARNRLGAGLEAQVRGPQLPHPLAGEIDLAFALRYERADQTVRALQPQVLDMRWPGLRMEGVQALQALLSRMSRDIGEVVLHQFTPRELALPDTMGFEPDQLQVVADGLVVHFGPKRPR